MMKAVVILAIVAVVGAGWVKNLLHLIGLDWADGVTIEVAFRIVGVFVAPIGAIMGYTF